MRVRFQELLSSNFHEIQFILAVITLLEGKHVSRNKLKLKLLPQPSADHWKSLNDHQALYFTLKTDHGQLTFSD